MAEIVNLRRERKRRARSDQAQAAGENRAMHGRSRLERTVLEQEARRRTAVLDGARLDESPVGEGDAEPS